MNSLFVSFCFFNLLNVIIQTVKSIATIKCGKTIAAAVNALAYGLYTYIIILTNADLNLFVKMGVVAGANFVGVWVVKWFEERSRKDKMWKVEMAIPYDKEVDAYSNLIDAGIPFNHLTHGKWTIFNCYCMEQKDTQMVVDMAKLLGGKLSAYESKMAF